MASTLAWPKAASFTTLGTSKGILSIFVNCYGYKTSSTLFFYQTGTHRTFHSDSQNAISSTTFDANMQLIIHACHTTVAALDCYQDAELASKHPILLAYSIRVSPVRVPFCSVKTLKVMMPSSLTYQIFFRKIDFCSLLLLLLTHKEFITTHVTSPKVFGN